MSLVPLAEATDPAQLGGKAVGLGDAIRVGLNVPPGFAVPWPIVAATAEGDPAAGQAIAVAYLALAGPVAVRSSAVDEDSAAASFAGQHLTVVNATSAEAVVRAVGTIRASALAPSALAYRARLGISTTPRMAVVVQRLVNPDSAGVMFTCDPLSGDDALVIEASWGLGEAVVAGLVSPDRFRLGRDGSLIEQVAGVKDVALVAAAGGGTDEVAIEPSKAAQFCLRPDQLRALASLADACDRAWRGPHDIEWAVAGDELFLLQRRPITGLG